ncbi:MAG: carboxymuconolactone decarboxylase family protein [Acidobacteriota bacterium]
MSDFKIHTLESAPKGSFEILSKAKEKYGFLPNLLGVLAESPSALKAYFTLGGLLEQTSFTPGEQQVILLAVSLENRCEYCVAAHSTVAKMQQVPPGVVEALRNDGSVADPRLRALSQFTRTLVRNRGWVSKEEIEDFLSAGFTRAQVLEVILAVAMKTLSNYTNHLAETPLDAPFEGAAWSARPAEGERVPAGPTVVK